MTMIVQDSHTSYPSLFVPLRRVYNAFIAARQKQAARRTADYLRNFPDDVLFRLGVSAAELKRIRDIAR
jgi:hypothetical protein